MFRREAFRILQPSFAQQCVRPKVVLDPGNCPAQCRLRAVVPRQTVAELCEGPIGAGEIVDKIPERGDLGQLPSERLGEGSADQFSASCGDLLLQPIIGVMDCTACLSQGEPPGIRSVGLAKTA